MWCVVCLDDGSRTGPYLNETAAARVAMRLNNTKSNRAGGSLFAVAKYIPDGPVEPPSVIPPPAFDDIENL
jgi:hypothetical protein